MKSHTGLQVQSYFFYHDDVEGARYDIGNHGKQLGVLVWGNVWAAFLLPFYSLGGSGGREGNTLAHWS
jgi:hypothetical protein